MNYKRIEDQPDEALHVSHGAVVNVEPKLILPLPYSSRPGDRSYDEQRVNRETSCVLTS